MKKIILSFLFISIALSAIQLTSCSESSLKHRSTNKILIVAADSAQLVLKDLIPNNIEYHSVTELEEIEEDSLAQYSTLVFYKTSLDNLLPYSQSLTERYIQAGNGVLLLECEGVSHSLTWPWMNKLEAKLDSNQVVDGEFLAYQGGRVLQKNKIDTAELETVISQGIGANAYDYSKVTSKLGPMESRYSIRTLVQGIHEPMEMMVMPNLDVIFLERRGKIKRFNYFSKTVSVINEFDVCTEGNYEDGLHGIVLDPGFSKTNNWVYLYYSPPCENPNQTLSRFEYKDGKLDQDSEIILLEVKVQRETCCHSGGAIEFDEAGNLYLSTGDNSISTESDGFSPIDERPGKYYNDSQKSSGNTNDLRGKIIRITPQPDGTYTIPEGNLFPTKEGLKGRPEIYAMGCRNPFRIGVDPKKGYVYWGDVGPDGRTAGPEGPLSNDEFNQAKKAGNFGWPHFVGDNKAYADKDFSTGKINGYFDPAAPLNDSPNNTGSQILPPANPAMIYYDYGASEKFPMLGTGGRSAMGGPVYYSDRKYNGTKVALPDYFDGKIFIYEWVRNWIKVITLDESDNMYKLEPFLPSEKFYGIIDMEVGPDGALYIMEYGNGYFLNNPEARLVRLEYYKDNQAPVAEILAENAQGIAPLKVKFSGSKTYDPDRNDSLTFNWYFDGDNNPDAFGKNVEWTYSKNGVFQPRLEVVDEHGERSNSTTKVIVGNTLPSLDFNLNGNQTFAFPNSPLNYKTLISDPEDEASIGIQTNQSMVSADYNPNDEYVYQILRGEKKLPQGSLMGLEGKNLIENSDCRTCHLDKIDSNGPSYLSIAARYDDAPITKETLITKIKYGGSGNWGRKSMAAHPELSEADASKMVNYILSMDKSNAIPIEGKINFENKINESGGYFLTASYKDQGYKQIESLQNRVVKVLRSPKVPAVMYDEIENAYASTYGANRGIPMLRVQGDALLRFNNIDLTGVRSIDFHHSPNLNGALECRVGSKTGKLIGQMTLSNNTDGDKWITKNIRLTENKEKSDLYFIFKKDKTTNQRQGNLCRAAWFKFNTN